MGNSFKCHAHRNSFLKQMTIVATVYAFGPCKPHVAVAHLLANGVAYCTEGMWSWYRECHRVHSCLQWAHRICLCTMHASQRRLCWRIINTSSLIREPASCHAGRPGPSLACATLPLFLKNIDGLVSIPHKQPVPSVLTIWQGRTRL